MSSVAAAPDALRVTRTEDAAGRRPRRPDSLNVSARSVSRVIFSGETAMSTVMQSGSKPGVPCSRSAAVTPARAGRGRGRGERRRQCDRGTSPGGPPGRHRRATPFQRSLSAIITSAEGSPVPAGVFGSLSGSYVQGASAVPSEQQSPSRQLRRRGPPRPPRPPGRWGHRVTRSLALGAGLLVDLGRRRLDDVDPGLGEQDRRAACSPRHRRWGSAASNRFSQREKGVVVLEVGSRVVG